MMCYRDRTYCSRPLEDCSCDVSRQITPQVELDAREWWGKSEGDPPFCVAPLCKGKVVAFEKKT